MVCNNCGHQLKEDALFCGKCGTKPQQQYTPPPVQPTPQASWQQPALQPQNVNNGKKFALIGLILGCISFIVFGILSLVGLPLCVVGRNKLAAAGEATGLAIAGIIVNSVAAALWIIFVL